MASSVFRRIVPASWLQLPYFVFIRCTQNPLTSRTKPVESSRPSSLGPATVSRAVRSAVFSVGEILSSMSAARASARARILQDLDARG